MDDRRSILKIINKKKRKKSTTRRKVGRVVFDRSRGLLNQPKHLIEETT